MSSDFRFSIFDFRLARTKAGCSIENRKSKIQNPSCRLVLASASPQRKQILAEAGYAFEVADPGDIEDAIGAASLPEELVAAKARAKAAHVAAALSLPYPAVAIGADTIVAAGDEIVGKPMDRGEAVSILTRLSGTRHRVISGLCLWPVTQRMKDEGGRMNAGVMRPAFIHGEKSFILHPSTGVATTWVQMRRMSAEQIQAYVASGESDGKAGAYAIQEGGDRFVESLEGSFLNVVGFPLELFEELLPAALREWGFDSPGAAWNRK